MNELGKLYDGKTRVVYPNATNRNIIDTIHSEFLRSVAQTKEFAERFRGDNQKLSALNVWRFLRGYITYKRDPKDFQDVRVPARFIRDKLGDCKSYSLFAAAIMKNLGYPVTFRYVSYDKDDSVPTHVYILSDNLVIDAVGQNRVFNVELPYYFKYDYPMQVRVLSGTKNNLQAPKLPVMAFHVRSSSVASSDEIGKIKLPRVGRFIRKNVKSAGKDVKHLAKEAGKLVKNLKVKKVLFVPARKAFLAMVALNARGIATRLSRLPFAELDHIWNKQFGGETKVLLRAIDRGKKKKPLLGASKRVRHIKGVGCVIDDGTMAGIGLAPVGVAAIIAAAAPILVVIVQALTKHKIPEVEGAEGSDSEVNDNPTLWDTIKETGQQMLDTFNNSGSMPEPSYSGSSAEVNEKLPEEEDIPGGSSFELSPELLLGAGVLAYFAFAD